MEFEREFDGLLRVNNTSLYITIPKDVADPLDLKEKEAVTIIIKKHIKEGKK